MTDFYQILQREKEIKKESNKQPEKENNQEPLALPREEKKDPKTIVRKSAARKKIVRKKRNPQPKIKEEKRDIILSTEAANPIWLTMSEAAKLGGLQKKTIKRAIRSNFLKYKIAENRYLVDLRSVILHLASRKKLWNKLNEDGIGQYIEKWKK